jgi:Raf kinase inhibitor-like YbhB/YbcL family protein
MITIRSAAFADGEAIPAQHTCSGADLSPPLTWEGVPLGTRSLALICDDPDAPGKTWVHWVLYGLPAGTTLLPGGLPSDPELADGSRQGVNDFGRSGYGGPCPPPGAPHRYFFKIYALEVELDLPPGASKRELLVAMEGHVLDEGALMGTFER